MNKPTRKHQNADADWGKLEALLDKEETNRLIEKTVGWQLIQGALEKNFKFKRFGQAIKFIDEVAKIAEKENHHPEILLWNIINVKLSLKTYCINGLSKLDFLLASEIDKIDSTD